MAQLSQTMKQKLKW